MYGYPGHRHLSSLYPLVVSYELDPAAAPDLRQAATYQGSESHYRMQASLCGARLGRGNGSISGILARGRRVYGR
jgi:hypothetical protein